MGEFEEDRGEVLERAWKGGIRAILCPAELTTPESLATSQFLAEKNPWIQLAAGVHPHRAEQMTNQHLEEMRSLAAQGRIKAIGEIGLDYYYNFSTPSRQQEAFRNQLALAQELSLPVVVHSRRSGQDILSALASEGFTRRGVLHCFTEDWETARRLLDFGFYLSFSGILTHPRAVDIRSVAQKTPLDRLLLETDSPYLVPESRRGQTKRNEPLFVVDTARLLAAIKKRDVEEIGSTVLNNHRLLFNV